MKFELDLTQVNFSWLSHPAFLVGAGLITGVVVHRVWLWATADAPAAQNPVPPTISAEPISLEELMGMLSTEEKVPAAPKPTKKKKAKKAKKLRPTKKRSSGQASKSSHGITVQNGRLRIDDWSKWMEYGPKTMDLAVDAGARTAKDVLNVILNLALPQYSWPPQRGSKLYSQWERMAGIVARTLQLPNPPPDDNQDESTPHLRLVQ